MKQIAIATLILALPSAMLTQTNASAATASNPVVNTVRLLEERQSKNLIGAADEMPAEKYSYHPTPEQMSFAHLVVHITEANNGYCARIAGEQPRENQRRRPNVTKRDRQYSWPPSEEWTSFVRDTTNSC